MPSTTMLSELRSAVEQLPAGLREHVLRVVDETRRLSQRYGVDIDRAEIAALGHDLVRAHSPAELVALTAGYGVDASEVERKEPILLHGPIGARIMAERFGIEDEQVLAAAHYHTTAREGMSPLERLIFVADKIETSKATKHPELARARELADESIESAMRWILDWQIARAVERGWPVHPDTVAARNELVLFG